MNPPLVRSFGSLSSYYLNLIIEPLLLAAPFSAGVPKQSAWEKIA